VLTFTGVKDYDDLVARYHKLPVAFDQTVEQMRKGLADGLMPPKFLLEKVADQAAAIAGQKPEDTAFAEPLAKFPASVPAAEQGRIRQAMLAAIRDDVLPAYRRFAELVKSEYAPRGRAEAGMWSLPDGAARYAFQVKSNTTTDLTPEQIHQIGLRQVAEIERQMTAIASRLGYADLKSFNAKVQGDPALRARSREQILDLYRGYIDAMYAKLPELFGRLPKARVEVVPVEAFREKEAPGANYQPGTIDGSRPGRVQVNTYDPTARKTLDEVEVQNETDRYIVWPGQALAYMVGQLKILELRDRAHRQLGARFDVRAFHDEVLGAGALPLDVLEARIDRWLAASKGGASQGAK
jgi:uncharacterized protein (DUF885 family)